MFGRTDLYFCTPKDKVTLFTERNFVLNAEPFDRTRWYLYGVCYCDPDRSLIVFRAHIKYHHTPADVNKSCFLSEHIFVSHILHRLLSQWPTNYAETDLLFRQGEHVECVPWTEISCRINPNGKLSAESIPYRKSLAGQLLTKLGGKSMQMLTPKRCETWIICNYFLSILPRVLISENQYFIIWLRN